VTGRGTPVLFNKPRQSLTPTLRGWFSPNSL
jgi:hypothetical protein